MQFPEYRARRVRKNESFRRLVRETRLTRDGLVYPLFVVPGKGVKKEVPSMPGQYNLSVDGAVDSAREAWDLGIPAVILFGIPEKKDAVGSEAWDDRGVVQRAIRDLKRALPDLLVMADACFCEYTDHGHCGVLTDGGLDNDASLENLARTANSYAKAGVDVVAPSGMLDGWSRPRANTSVAPSPRASPSAPTPCSAPPPSCRASRSRARPRWSAATRCTPCRPGWSSATPACATPSSSACARSWTFRHAAWRPGAWPP